MPSGQAQPVPERPALSAYGQVLSEGGRLWLCHADGSVEFQDSHRWVAGADAVDRRMLARCSGPTLDVGCGPGRLVAALAGAGTPVLGIDVSAHAVTLARARGALVLRRDVFGSLPGKGRWACVLLADGNIGIGGEPRRLLRRIAALGAPDARLIVEVARGDVDRRGPVRIVTCAGVVSRPFRWAALGAPALLREAAAAGWRAHEVWEDGGRRFVTLRRCRQVAGGDGFDRVR